MADGRLTKFIADQEEAVRLARDTVDGPDKVRSEALYVAMQIAGRNAENASAALTAREVISDARRLEAYLRGES